ncbi:hypothetical protein HDV00_003348 [Rhizophlyctis rosea]|nr:hypothetical protein HDV00_003348 [Rhizophlyctis rosea]
MVLCFMCLIVFAFGQWIPGSILWVNETIGGKFTVPHKDFLMPTSTRLEVDKLMLGDVLGALAVCVWVEVGKIPEFLFSSGPIQWLGKISMGIYCFHELVLSSIMSRSIWAIYLKGLTDYRSLVWISLAITVSATLLIAWMFHHLVETPLNKFSTWLWMAFFVNEWSFVKLDEAMFALARSAVTDLPLWFLDMFTLGLFGWYMQRQRVKHQEIVVIRKAELADKKFAL